MFWSAVRIHLHLCFMPTNLKLLSARQNKISDKPLLDRTCCYLFKVRATATHPLSLLQGVQVHATTTTTTKASRHFLYFLASSHMHTICILISLEWFRQQKKTLPPFPPSSSPPLNSVFFFFFFLSTCQSVSLHHHHHLPHLLASVSLFYLSACLSVVSVCPAPR